MSSNPSSRGSLLLASRLLFGCLPLALPAIAYAQQQVQAFDIAPGPSAKCSAAMPRPQARR